MARNPIATIPFVARTIEGALRVCTGRPWHVTVVEVFDTFVNIRAVVDAIATIPGGARALKGALRIGAHTEVRLAIVLVARTLVLCSHTKYRFVDLPQRIVASLGEASLWYIILQFALHPFDAVELREAVVAEPRPSPVGGS